MHNREVFCITCQPVLHTGTQQGTTCTAPAQLNQVELRFKVQLRLECAEAVCAASLSKHHHALCHTQYNLVSWYNKRVRSKQALLGQTLCVLLQFLLDSVSVPDRKHCLSQSGKNQCTLNVGSRETYCDKWYAFITDQPRSDQAVLVAQKVGTGLRIIWVQGPCKSLKPLAVLTRGNGIPNLQSL